MEDLEKSFAQEDISKTLANSISPEYKSSWNDVDIKGDYDQYARSVGPSRLQDQILKQVESTSPRTKDTKTYQEKSTPRKARVKLSKTNNQIVKAPSLSPDKAKPNQNESAPVIEPKTKNLLIKHQQDEVSAPSKSHNQEHGDEDITAKSFKYYDQNNEPGINKKDSQEEKNKTNEESERTKKEPETKKKDIIPLSTETPVMNINMKSYSHLARRSKNLNKSSQEFTPPIVTAVDFREPSLTETVKAATKNGLLIENSDYFDNKPQDGNVSRMSTLLMASYLGMNYHPNPNLITSFTVKPLLPPLKPKRRTGKRQKNFTKKNFNQENPELQIVDKKRNPNSDPSNDTNSKELAPLRDTHLYKWKHNTGASCSHVNEIVKPVPYRLPARRNDIETIFDQIVRWRSKVRHPAMYRRGVSPTLGEEALKRKFTDRLPSRQVRKPHHNAPVSFELHEGHETSRKKDFSTEPQIASVKKYIAERLQDAQNHGSLTSPSVIEDFSDVTVRFKSKSLKRHWELNHKKHEVMQVPLPDLSLRKRQPIWQRMK